MVGEAVYGWGRAGWKNAARGNDDRGKDVVPVCACVIKNDPRFWW